MWKEFTTWAKGKNITTHTIGAAILGFAVAYNSSATLRNYIGTLLVGYPVVVTKIGMLCADIVAGVTLWRNYSHSSTSASTVAQAHQIMASDNPPTQTQVLAVTPPAK